MATRDTDLTSLRIDRSAPTGGSSRKFRALRKIVGWLIVITLIGGGFLLLKDYFNPGLEVQLVTASLTSPALANAVLTASGYVVARRKAAFYSFWPAMHGGLGGCRDIFLSHGSCRRPASAQEAAPP